MCTLSWPHSVHFRWTLSLLNIGQEKTKHAVTPKYLSLFIFLTFFCLLSIAYDVRFITLYLRTYFILQGFKEEKNIVYTLKDERLTGMTTFGVGTVFLKGLLKEG